jgi:hypothetical protein
MHFRLKCPWTEAKEEVFMDVVEDVLKQEINLNKQKISQSSQDRHHKIVVRDGQVNQ